MIGKSVSLGFKALAVSLASVLAVAPSGVLAMGGVVTDPTSYTYYVAQIKKLQENIEAARNTVDTLGGIKEKTNDIYRSVRGSYNRAVSMKDSVDGLGASIEKTPANLKKFGQKLTKVPTAGGGSRFVSATEVMDKLYVDPSAPGKGDGRLRDPNRRQRYEVQEGAFRSMIDYADTVLAGAGKRVENIEKLRQAIDQTENLKDAQDLNNRLVLEVLMTNTELLIVVAQLAEAEGLARYTGVSDKVSQDLSKQKKDADSGAGGRQLDAHDKKMVEQMGGTVHKSWEDLEKGLHRHWE